MGGGEVTPEIAQRFVALAGGRHGRFVYIPTAAPDEEIVPTDLAAWFRTTFGVDDVTILHTRDRAQADTTAFAAPIEAATGVWFGGGRQWRIADAYLGTRVETALHGVLRRHGIVAGTSAGASILASYLVRGAPEGNWILSAPGHERGFGLLSAAAVDQHVDRYRRETDIEPVLRSHRNLLGIGLDEATAITVIDGTCTVLGVGRVILHDGKPHGALAYAVLHAGDRFDLATSTVSRRVDP
jgi:cyanophycinase